jgi:hypothetical protein
MEPQNIRFGGGAASSFLHPLVAVGMVLAIVLILFLPRKHVIAPLLLAFFTIPIGQVIVLGGVHFTMARILILASLTRLLVSRRSLPEGTFAGGLNSVDRAFLLWAAFFWAIFSLQWMETQAFIKSAADFIDAVGCYVVMRAFIRDKEDVQRTVKVLGVLCVILGVGMIIEQIKDLNVFGLLGGIPANPAIRDGKIRSQGALEVYLTAGAFGATLLPLLIWLWTEGKSRLIAGLGIVGATAMTITSNSSTPQAAYAAGILALCFWPLRKQMWIFRWGLAITILGLHLVMKAPVWALIDHLDLTGSSSSYHRFMLVDNTIRHFTDWWLLGYKYYDTWAFDMWDLSNQYVVYALRGGLATLVMFLLIISRSFSRLGTARKLIDGNRTQEWMLWCLGSAMLVHLAIYFGVNYFDQMQFAWYALLAMISAAVAGVSIPAVRQSAEAATSQNPIGSHQVGLVGAVK